MSHLTCGFIGLGLIGGSIAKALKERIPSAEIVAYDVENTALLLACKEGVADVAAPYIDGSFSRCDYIFLCAPVQKNDENLRALKAVLSPGCVVTDVGSVKAGIHRAAQEAGLGDRFIGGHPMTGSERTGYANAKASLLENAYYILTPSPLLSPQRTEAFRRLVASLGAIPLVLESGRHDYVTGAVSHLPHVAASSLVNLIREQDEPDGLMRLIAAGGFKDITRIASASPAMWQQICLANGENISRLLSAYIQALTEFQRAIQSRDEKALYRLFDDARRYRDSFADSSAGPLKRAYRLSVDIADRTGALADVVSLFAQNGLSIKNIAISHNRESEDGVLQVEFYREDALRRAKELLLFSGYCVPDPG